ARERVAKSGEIPVVAGAVFQADIEIARRFEEWIVVLLVHREREDARVALEDQRRSVAVVDVEIDDGPAREAATVLQHANRDGDVVQRTEPLAMRGERVMQAAAEVRRTAVLERRRRGVTGAADHQPEGVRELGPPWELERRTIVRRQRVVAQFG